MEQKREDPRQQSFTFILSAAAVVDWPGKSGEQEKLVKHTHILYQFEVCVCVCVCVCVHRKDEKTTRYSLIDLHTLKTRQIVKLYSKKEKGKLNFASSETTTSVPSGIFLSR